MKKVPRINYRKGVFSQLQLAILAIFIIIIFSFFLYKTYENLKERMSVQGCRSSIAAHSLVASSSAREIFTDIKCPTREITIKHTKDAKEIIAEDMHRCWYIWGNGEGQYFQGDGNFCHICTVYAFADKGQQVDGLLSYLTTNNVKSKYPSEGLEVTSLSYVEYFQGYATANSAEMVDAQAETPIEGDSIDTSQKYTTVFVYASGKEAIQKALEGGGRTKLGTASLGFGLAGGVASYTAGHIGMASGAAAVTGGTAPVLTTITATTPAGLTFTSAPGVIQGALWLPEAAGGAGVGGAGAAGATVLGITPVGWALIGIGAVVIAGVGIYMVLDVEDPEWISYIAFRPYNAEELDALDCQKLEVNQMSNAGK